MLTLRTRIAKKLTRTKNSFVTNSLSVLLQKDIPVFVPCRNNYTYVCIMINQLKYYNIQNIVLIDNGTTYSELVKLLHNPPDKVSVVLLGENKGPRHIITDDLSYNLLPNYFCLTDPDIEFNINLPSDFISKMIDISEKHKIGKVGLALSLADKTEMIQNKIMYDEPMHIWDHESQFWEKTVGVTDEDDPIYDAHIDTTFALYNKKFFSASGFFSSLRVAGRFTGRHLPWYIDNKMPKSEDEYYRSNSTYSYYLRSDPNSKTAYQNNETSLLTQEKVEVKKSNI